MEVSTWDRSEGNATAEGRSAEINFLKRYRPRMRL
jgi:hypothetical protein